MIIKENIIIVGRALLIALGIFFLFNSSDNTPKALPFSISIFVVVILVMFLKKIVLNHSKAPVVRNNIAESARHKFIGKIIVLLYLLTAALIPVFVFFTPIKSKILEGEGVVVIFIFESIIGMAFLKIFITLRRSFGKPDSFQASSTKYITIPFFLTPTFICGILFFYHHYDNRFLLIGVALAFMGYRLYGSLRK